MDREKVKKGLEIILNGCDEIQCEDCCFHIKEPTKPRRCGMIEEQIQEGALALLKEQEAFKPVRDEKTGRIWLCGNCGSYVGFEDNDPHDPNEYDNYCRKCGKPVLWEGR